MGQIVRDLGMTLIVALVVHALYSARRSRHAPPPQEQPQQRATPPAAASVVELPPAGFSVFPWAP